MNENKADGVLAVELAARSAAMHLQYTEPQMQASDDMPAVQANGGQSERQANDVQPAVEAESVQSPVYEAPDAQLHSDVGPPQHEQEAHNARLPFSGDAPHPEQLTTATLQPNGIPTAQSETAAAAVHEASGSLVTNPEGGTCFETPPAVAVESGSLDIIPFQESAAAGGQHSAAAFGSASHEHHDLSTKSTVEDNGVAADDDATSLHCGIASAVASMHCDDEEADSQDAPALVISSGNCAVQFLLTPYHVSISAAVTLQLAPQGGLHCCSHASNICCSSAQRPLLI